jgi:hypothetical protein
MTSRSRALASSAEGRTVGDGSRVSKAAQGGEWAKKASGSIAMGRGDAGTEARLKGATDGKHGQRLLAHSPPGLLLGAPPAANPPYAAGKTAPKPAETLGSFTPRYEYS